MPKPFYKQDWAIKTEGKYPYRLHAFWAAPATASIHSCFDEKLSFIINLSVRIK